MIHRLHSVSRVQFVSCCLASVTWSECCVKSVDYLINAWTERTTHCLYGKLSSLGSTVSLSAFFSAKFYLLKRWLSLFKVVKLKWCCQQKALLRWSRRRAIVCFNRRWFYLFTVCVSNSGVHAHCVLELTAFKTERTQVFDRWRNI